MCTWKKTTTITWIIAYFCLWIQAPWWLSPGQLWGPVHVTLLTQPRLLCALTQGMSARAGGSQVDGLFPLQQLRPFPPSLRQEIGATTFCFPMSKEQSFWGKKFLVRYSKFFSTSPIHLSRFFFFESWPLVETHSNKPFEAGFVFGQTFLQQMPCLLFWFPRELFASTRCFKQQPACFI